MLEEEDGGPDVLRTDQFAFDARQRTWTIDLSVLEMILHMQYGSSMMSERPEDGKKWFRMESAKTGIKSLFVESNRTQSPGGEDITIEFRSEDLLGYKVIAFND